MTINKQISLDEQETQVRDFLVGAANFYAQANGQVPVLRFAGGWVRDKLLGGESKDIDVAIDCMSGKEFYFALQQYETSKDSKGARQNSLGRLGEIKKDAEKSKHLETATTKLFGLELDLVNLRTETYNEDSRNPEVEMGTAEEDALRRDATINAMFYNLNTQEIEDFTGRGLDDLEAGIIRTPLAAEQTFRDDPLRILRLIRFACRFGFQLEDGALHWMKDPAIQRSLERKISRERILVELEKTLKGPRPAPALELIIERGLYNTIFTVPNEDGRYVPRPDPSTMRRPIQELQNILSDQTPNAISLREILAADLMRWKVWLICALLPWFGQKAPEDLARKGSPTVMAARVARDGLKVDNDTMRIITSAVIYSPEVRAQWKAMSQEKLEPTSPTKRKRETADRVTVGMAIRRWGHDWRFVAAAGLLVDIAEARDDEAIVSVKQNCAKWLDTVQREKLSEFWNSKSLEGMPILNGGEIFELVKKRNPSIRKGKWMSEAVNVTAEYQLGAAETASKQGASESLLDAIDTGRLVLD